MVVVKYQVVDLHTGLNVGKPHATRNSASNKVDRLDNAYGGYRYTVKAVEVQTTTEGEV